LVTYTWPSALLILSVVALSNCFFGMFFKPLPDYKELEPEKETCQAMLEEDLKEEKVVKGEEEGTFKNMILLFRDWAFMMFAVSNFLTSLGYPIPYTFVPDNSVKQGLTEGQGSFLIGLIGITNTAARIILGIVSLKLNRLFLYNTCLVVCGLAMCLTNYFQPILAYLASQDCTLYNSSLPLVASSISPSIETDFYLPHNSSVIEEMESVHWACDQYVGQLLYANIYGVTSAAYVLLTTLVLADLLGADKFTNAFGLLLLFQGVATFIGPPIVGFMFDAFNSYNPGFITMGVMIALSGLMLYPIPYIQRYLGQGNGYKEVNIEME